MNFQGNQLQLQHGSVGLRLQRSNELPININTERQRYPARAYDHAFSLNVIFVRAAKSPATQLCQRDGFRSRAIYYRPDAKSMGPRAHANKQHRASSQNHKGTFEYSHGVQS